jgi:hypothetical protein
MLFRFPASWSFPSLDAAASASSLPLEGGIFVCGGIERGERMGKRRRERKEGKRFELYTHGGPIGPQSKGWLLIDELEKLVVEGKAIRVHDNESGVVLCYQLTSSVKDSVAARPTIDSSDSMLSNAEVDAVVGEHFKGGENIFGVNGGPSGRSHTAGLSRAKRKVREVLGLEPIDFVEASRFKLNAFHPKFGRTVVQQQSC